MGLRILKRLCRYSFAEANQPAVSLGRIYIPRYTSRRLCDLLSISKCSHVLAVGDAVDVVFLIILSDVIADAYGSRRRSENPCGLFSAEISRLSRRSAMTHTCRPFMRQTNSISLSINFVILVLVDYNFNYFILSIVFCFFISRSRLVTSEEIRIYFARFNFQFERPILLRAFDINFNDLSKRELKSRKALYGDRWVAGKKNAW